MKNKILLLTGIFIITFMLYNRLFCVRIPRNFSEIINSPYYYLYFLLILGFIIMLVITAFELYKYLLNIPENTNFIKRKFSIIMEHPYNPIKIISNSILNLDSFIKNSLPPYNELYSYSDIIIIKCAHIFFNKTIKIITIIIIFCIIPQMIVCLSFVYDIIFLNKFTYFYKSLILLIFPVILRYMIHSITTLINTNLEGLNDGLDLRIIPAELYSDNVPLEQYEIISIYEWRDILLTPHRNDYVCYNNLSKKALDDFNDDLISATYSLKNALNVMNTLFIINKFMHTYNQYKFILETPIKIIKYVLYIIGWLYILYSYC